MQSEFNKSFSKLKVNITVPDYFKSIDTLKPASTLKAQSTLIKNLVSQVNKKPLSPDFILLILEWIHDESITEKSQLVELFNWLARSMRNNKSTVESIKSEFPELEKICGRGISLTSDQLEEKIMTILENHAKNVKAIDGNSASNAFKGSVMKILRDDDVLKFLSFKPIFSQVNSLLSNKSYLEKLESKYIAPLVAAVASNSTTKSTSTSITEEDLVEQGKIAKMAIFTKLPKVTDDELNTSTIFNAHLKRINNKTITRFPPEPNGYMHLGHAKSCNLNFGYANFAKGDCILRFDDTNPETEKQEYIDSIISATKFLGHKWSKITYSSQYFDKLFELAVQLVKQGDAHVCELNAIEVKQQRAVAKKKNGIIKPCRCRNRPISENLQLFYGMRDGKFNEGELCLRMNMDLSSKNPNMHDLVAYRIKYHSHPKSGDKWCIYPTYDFTHCICDSLEDITHSMCTLEFEGRRESYYWLLDKLGLYKPYEFEMSRLNLAHTVMSKRKMIALVEEKYVDGWDDPRMPTVYGLRRRGLRSTCFESFCNAVAVTRASNLISHHLLEDCIRRDLDGDTPRVMGVIDPLLVKIVATCDGSDPQSIKKSITSPIHPVAPMGEHSLTFTNEFYIDQSDFLNERDLNKHFYGLQPSHIPGEPGKWVHLRRAFNIRVLDVVTDSETGKPKELSVEVDFTNSFKSKGHLTWISLTDAIPAEFRKYDVLFSSSDCSKLGDDWRKHIQPNSKKIFNGYLPLFCKNQTVRQHIQLERFGYFVKDIDSTKNRPVYVESVSLKSSKKKAV